MNFQNLPGQLIVLLIGWAFTLYLQYNANRRAEALKRKDKIIDRLDNLSSWVEDEVEKKTLTQVWQKKHILGSCWNWSCVLISLMITFEHLSSTLKGSASLGGLTFS